MSIGIGSGPRIGALMATGPLGWASQHFGWRVAMAVAAVRIVFACSGIWLTMGGDRRRGPWPHSLPAMYASSVRMLAIPALSTLLPLCLAIAAGTAFRTAWGGSYLSDVFDMEIGVRGLGLAFLSFSGFCSALLLPALVRRFSLKRTIGAWSVFSMGAAATLACVPALDQYPAISLMTVLSNIGMLPPPADGTRPKAVSSGHARPRRRRYEQLCLSGIRPGRLSVRRSCRLRHGKSVKHAVDIYAAVCRRGARGHRGPDPLPFQPEID
jgi:predicted MFS family arabinose efflux permease